MHPPIEIYTTNNTPLGHINVLYIFYLNYVCRSTPINFSLQSAQFLWDCMCGMLLLFRSLLHFPQSVDKHLHAFRLVIRKRVLATKVTIIPEPLFMLRVAGIRNRPLLEDCRIVHQYIIRDKKHVMLSGKLSNMQKGISSDCEIIFKIDSWGDMCSYYFLNCS